MRVFGEGEGQFWIGFVWPLGQLCKWACFQLLSSGYVNSAA